MTWTQAISGRAVDLEQPEPEAIELEDIAHALSMQCRFNGHVRGFYSVAEHSMHVMNAFYRRAPSADPEALAFALLHDAAEAYLGDMIAPLKRIDGMQWYSVLETRFESAILERFELAPTVAVRRLTQRCDLYLLARERDVLLRPPPRDWRLPAWVRPEPCELCCWSPEAAKERFLDAAARLGLR